MLMSPGFLWFLLFIPPLVYLHMRRRQRTEITVSSLFLWTDLSGLVQSRFRRKLNENLHLILQIIIIILLSLLLSEPFIFLKTIPVERTVVIIDASASMGVVENGTSRFEAAVSEAVSVLQDRRGQNTAVLLAGTNAVQITDFGETTKSQINKVKELSYTDIISNINGALLKAENLIDNYESSEIILISDGAFNSNNLVINSDLHISFIPVGFSDGNVGITEIESRKDPDITNVHHIFVNIQNSSDKEVETDLVLYLNGEEYSRTQLLIPSYDSVSSVPVINTPTGQLEVFLDYNDPYPLDNRAYMVLKTGNPVSLLLISDGNFYLQSLFSLNEGIDLTVMKDQPENLNYDIVVFDKPPIGNPGPGNYIFFAYAPNNYNIEYLDTVNFPGIKSWNPEHPVMASVDPRSFSVYQTLGTKAGNELLPILEGEVPLIYTFNNKNYKSVYFTFRLNASDLVLRPAFPLLLGNTIEWMFPEIESGLIKSSRTGKRIVQKLNDIDLSIDNVVGKLINSEGNISFLPVKNNSCSFFPEKAGFYKLEVFGSEYGYAVNLISSEESNINKRFNLPDQEQADDKPGTKRIYPLRQILIILILLLIVFELILTVIRREGSGFIGKIQLGFAFISILFLVISNFPLIKEKVESTVIFLMDNSRSISMEDREAAVNWISMSLPDVEKDIAVGMVVFGKDAEVIKHPDSDRLDINSVNLPLSEESNLELGLKQAYALLPDKGDQRIIILTDGNETDGNILELIRSTRDSNIKISTVPLSGFTYKNEIIARSIIGESRVSPFEHISLTLEIESQEESEGNLFFYLDGKYYGEDSINIQPGRSLISYQVNLKKPGFHLFEAVIESRNDNVFENNQFQKMIFVEGTPPVLYVHNGSGPSDMLLEPLKDHGFNFEIIEASLFPNSMYELFSYDSVILDNIPAYFFSISKMEMIREAVSGGLGLFVIGGDNSLGAGGYYNTPLEKAIPVDVDITSSLDLPGTAIVMVIDNSGSMQDAISQDERKIDLAKQAVYSALEVLEEGDTAGILSFDSAYNWIVKIEPELNMEKVGENLFPLSPGGGTVLFPALEEAYRVLNSTSASVKHILILSDGYTDSEDFEVLLGNIRNSGITVSTVSVGSGSNKQLMENIAAWGRGRSYYTDDIRSVPSIFVSESLKASKRLFVEETFFPIINQPHEILTGLSESLIPPLHGFMLSYPKNNSEILLRGLSDNPLLSVWQYGLGRSAVFTSNLSSSWARDWYLWDSSSVMFSQLLRWISRGDPDKGLKLSLSHNRSTIYIDVEARSTDGDYLNGLDLYGKVILPNLLELDLDIVQEAAGRYTGKLPVSLDGNYFVTVAEKGESSNSRMENINAAFISVPYPQEYRTIRPSFDLLDSIRILTNGDNLSLKKTLESEFFEIKPGSNRTKTENWQLFVLLGFIIFLITLFLRLQPPQIYFVSLLKSASSLLNPLTGKPLMSYDGFREKMESIRSEQEDAKHNHSFWFGKEEIKEDHTSVYISKTNKK
jgi:Mg-chelatase subunit ChlD